MRVILISSPSIRLLPDIMESGGNGRHAYGSDLSPNIFGRSRWYLFPPLPDSRQLTPLPSRVYTLVIACLTPGRSSVINAPTV